MVSFFRLALIIFNRFNSFCVIYCCIARIKSFSFCAVSTSVLQLTLCITIVLSCGQGLWFGPLSNINFVLIVFGASVQSIVWWFVAFIIESWAPLLRWYILALLVLAQPLTSLSQVSFCYFRRFPIYRYSLTDKTLNALLFSFSGPPLRLLQTSLFVCQWELLTTCESQLTTRHKSRSLSSICQQFKLEWEKGCVTDDE